MPTALPHLSMLLSVAFWSSSATAIKFILPVIPVFEAVAFRFTIAATLLWLVVLAASQLRHLRALGWQPFIAGIIDPGIIAVMAYVALTMTTAVHAVVIMSTMPIFASIFGRIFLKESLTLPVTGGSLIGLAGTVVLVSDTAMGSKATLIGDALMVSAVLLICFAQLVLRRIARDRGHPLLMTALMITGGALSGYIALGMFGEAAPLAWAAEANTAVWLVFLYTGTFISAAAFFFYNFALRHIQMGRLSLYSVLQAPLGVALAAIVLGESVSTVEGAGIVLVIIGVSLPALSNFLQARGGAPTEAPPQV